MIFLFDKLHFQVLSIDRYKHQNGVFHVEKRPFAALSFRTSGTGRFEIGSQSFLSKPGDILYLPSHVSYTVEYSVSESIVVHLTDCNYNTPENLSLHADAFLSEKFEHLAALWHAGVGTNRIKSEIFALLADMSELSETHLDSRFADCLAYLEQNFRNPSLSLADICRAGHVSESTFRRAFYRCYGMAPKKHIDTLRLRYGAALIAEQHLSVKEAAFCAGFTDEKYFSKCIKAMYGVPPSVFGKIE